MVIKKFGNSAENSEQVKMDDKILTQIMYSKAKQEN